MDENARLTTPHGRVEFITTMHYIQQYLKPGQRVAEIGAGPGRYSAELARLGLRVDAVELLDKHYAKLKKRASQHALLTAHQGNALDLDMFEDETFDGALLLGPMYHLNDYMEQVRALSEAMRITKHGGYVFIAYCMQWPSLMTHGFKKGLPDMDPGAFTLYTMDTVIAMREEFDIGIMGTIAVDGYANHIRDEVDAMDAETYREFVRQHLLTCERPELLGYSHHILDIWKKP